MRGQRTSGQIPAKCASGLAAAACQRGKKAKFDRVTELITQMLEAREERLLGRLRGQLARLDLLALDRCGATNNVVFLLKGTPGTPPANRPETGTLVVKVPEGDVQPWIDGQAEGVADAGKVARLEVPPGKHTCTRSREALAPDQQGGQRQTEPA